MQAETLRSASESRRVTATLCVLLLAGVFVAHFRSLRAMVDLWSVSPMYSYAFTVPFISGYLLWSRREQFASLTPRGTWIASTPVLLGAVALLQIGRATGVLVLQQLAFFISLLGIVLAVLGPAYLRTGWAGFGYLLLMIPIWDGVTESLHGPFQDRSAAIGIDLMRAFGVPAYRDGRFIELPGTSLEVARECSGVNYLVAVVALGLPLAYLYLRSPLRRVMLVSSAVLVAALSNGLRVALIGALAYHGIDAPLHGPMHMLHGLFVAGIGYVALFAGLRWLSRGEDPAAAATASGALRPGLRVPVLPVAVLALAFWGLAAAPYARAKNVEPSGASLESVPVRLGSWTSSYGTASGMVDAARWWPEADAELHRRYFSDDGARVDVFVAYFASQQQHRLTSFRASKLHEVSALVDVSALGGGTFPANRLSLPNPDTRESLFWYVVDGQVTAARYSAASRSAWNALVRGNSRGVVVLMTAPKGQALSTLEDLAAHVQHALEAGAVAR